MLFLMHTNDLFNVYFLMASCWQCSFLPCWNFYDLLLSDPMESCWNYYITVSQLCYKFSLLAFFFLSGTRLLCSCKAPSQGTQKIVSVAVLSTSIEHRNGRIALFIYLMYFVLFYFCFVSCSSRLCVFFFLSGKI